MNTFEGACEDTERRASDLVRTLKQTQRIAARLEKAAKLGDHAAITGAASELADATKAMLASSDLARGAWPFDDDRLSEYLRSRYQDELVRAASRAGVTITELDDRLAAFPLILQIQPTQHAVKVDAQRTRTLRPSALAKRIADQRKHPGTKPQQFLEVLHATYRRAGATGSAGATLSDLYEILTLHPDTRRTYSRAEFARDVFLLDASGVRATKSGAKVSFPAATGTKGGAKVFQVVTEDGMPKNYYGIRFQETPR